MITKHFFKILLVFAAMIVLGLLVAFLVNFFGGGNVAGLLNNEIQLAK